MMQYAYTPIRPSSPSTAQDPKFLVTTFLEYLAYPSPDTENTFRYTFNIFEKSIIQKPFNAPSLLESILLKALLSVLRSIGCALKYSSKLQDDSINPVAMDKLSKDLIVLYRLCEFVPSMSTSQQIEFISEWTFFINSELGQSLISLIFSKKVKSEHSSTLTSFLKKPILANPILVNTLKNIGNLLLQSLSFLFIKEVHLPHSTASFFIKDIQVLLVDSFKWLPLVWGLFPTNTVKSKGCMSDKLFEQVFFDIILAFLIEKLRPEDSVWILQVLFANCGFLSGIWTPETLLKVARKKLGPKSKHAFKMKVIPLGFPTPFPMFSKLHR